jgi:RHS repeat-associated protein
VNDSAQRQPKCGTRLRRSDAFGRTEVTGTPRENAFGFSGREDDGTGLYYYRARYYDPTRSRFVQEDPIGLRGGVNVFRYARGNPLRWADPFGLWVAVALYPGGGGQGHIGIGVNTEATQGLYPTSRWTALWGPGIVQADTGKVVESIRIETTPEEDRLIQAYIDSHSGTNSGPYSLLGRNCARFVEDALAAAGKSSSDTIDPWILMRILRERYDRLPRGAQQNPLGDGLFLAPDPF